MPTGDRASVSDNLRTVCKSPLLLSIANTRNPTCLVSLLSISKINPLVCVVFRFLSFFSSSCLLYLQQMAIRALKNKNIYRFLSSWNLKTQVFLNSSDPFTKSAQKEEKLVRVKKKKKLNSTSSYLYSVSVQMSLPPRSKYFVRD